MATNIQMLGDALAARMKKSAGAAVGVVAELGTINANSSLTCDSIGGQIPKGEYMVNSEAKPSAGDRVLVIWCGNDAIVAAVVKES